MEDVLDLYTQPFDPLRPVVCMDEANKQLVQELRPKLPMVPGHPETYDHQYKRAGVCNLFMFVEPLSGWRSVFIEDFRRKKEWVQCIKTLLETQYKDAKVVRIVLDNLNTHNPSAFYQFYPPDEAKAILDRLEFHFTPKHASWLNIAEIEFSVLSRQCLNQRIPSKEILEQEVSSWVLQRNKNSKKVDWQFTTTDARIKLKKLYPSFSA
jgi:hypothetical protein